MLSEFLICKPVYYGIDYEINPWMKDQIGTVNRGFAMEQWQALVACLNSIANVTTTEIDQASFLPDMVFTANAGLVVGDFFYMSNFKHFERVPESYLFASYFASLGYALITLPRKIHFEGAGDALFDISDRLWMGYGFRTDYEAARFLGSHLEGYTLRLVDPRFYHLDTCFCPLSNGRYRRDFLYYPGAFDDISLGLIRGQKTFDFEFETNLIEVSEEDANNFACNAINVNENIILNRASDTLKETLEKLGYNVIETPLTEFIKAGGSAKCLTLKL
jgi:N-dimethylarginine dimethylaminohydrolase